MSDSDTVKRLVILKALALFVAHSCSIEAFVYVASKVDENGLIDGLELNEAVKAVAPHRPS